MKITLAEFKAFADQLSDEWYFDGDECFISEEFWDGKFNPSDVINVNKEEITLCYQGNEPRSVDESYIDFLPKFKEWKTGCAYEYIGVKIPKGNKDALMSLIKDAFGEMKE